MANWEMKAGDLYPPLPVMLSDSNGPIDLTNATSVSIVAKGAKPGGVTITGSLDMLQVAFTANTTMNSAQLTSVSSFTDLWAPGRPPWANGSTLFGAGIPGPTGAVGAWVQPTILALNSGAGTITMSQQATATATAVPMIGNFGVCEYAWASMDTAVADTYNGEFPIVWTSGSKPQTVPNQLSNNVTILIDAVQ